MIVLLFVMVLGGGANAPRVDARADVEYLLELLEERCGHFFARKGIDWRKVRAEFTREAKQPRDAVAHLELIERLLARLEDGHAGIVATTVERPDEPEPKGVGLRLGVAGRDVVVTEAWGPAAASGIAPGFVVKEIEGDPARAWLEARARTMCERHGASTDHSALHRACTRGLADVPGTSWSFVFRQPDGKTKRLTLTCARGGGNGVPDGPVRFPDGVERLGRQAYGRVDGDLGYVHLRNVPVELPEQLDTMLAALGDVRGLVLDLRSNAGGGVDHGAVFDRFLAEGETCGRYGGGPAETRFTGPMVVIVDAGTASAGETIAGMLLQTGRAYGIGPTATAGMSGDKEEVELPSGLATVRFTVRSWRAGGDGDEIEGVGVRPHEVVEYGVGELAAGKDPGIEMAVRLLRKGLPEKVVGKAEWRAVR